MDIKQGEELYLINKTEEAKMSFLHPMGPPLVFTYLYKTVFIPDYVVVIKLV